MRKFLEPISPLTHADASRSRCSSPRGPTTRGCRWASRTRSSQGLRHGSPGLVRRREGRGARLPEEVERRLPAAGVDRLPRALPPGPRRGATRLGGRGELRGRRSPASPAPGAEDSARGCAIRKLSEGTGPRITPSRRPAGPGPSPSAKAGRNRQGTTATLPGLRLFGPAVERGTASRGQLGGRRWTDSLARGSQRPRREEARAAQAPPAPPPKLIDDGPEVPGSFPSRRHPTAPRRPGGRQRPAGGGSCTVTRSPPARFERYRARSASS